LTAAIWRRQLLAGRQQFLAAAILVAEILGGSNSWRQQFLAAALGSDDLVATILGRLFELLVATCLHFDGGLDFKRT